MLEKMSFFANLYQVDTNPKVGMWMLYGTIIVLSAIVYHLGFARKLSVLKKYCYLCFVSDWMHRSHIFCCFLTSWRRTCCSGTCIRNL